MRKIFDEYGVFGCICVIVLAIAIIFGALCLDAWIALMLWDWVVVNTLGWVAPGVVGFWEMLGLLMLCNILFKTPSFGKKSNDE